MRAIVSVVFVLVVFVGAAQAQPGQVQPPPVQPPPVQPYPGQEPYPAQPPPYPAQPPPGQPQPYPAQPPPYAYPPIQLTPEEHEMLMAGEISDGQHIVGVVASLGFGFGVGQAVQGRYSDTGWIFTVGELASITALMVGVFRAFDDCLELDDSCNDGNSDGVPLIVAGAIGLTVFRIWEIVDAIGGPSKHNARVRELRMRLGIPQPMYTKITPYVVPSRDGGGGTAGLSFRF